jgi:hypothetical protein
VCSVLTTSPKRSTAMSCPTTNSPITFSLFGASPLLRPDGRAVYTYTTSSVDFFSGSSAVPFLSGTKAPGADLWHLQLPAPISA